MVNKKNNSKQSQKIKINVKNEKIKNKYFEYISESHGFCDSTLNAVKKAIYRYEEFTDFEDYGKFGKKRAIEFKKWLEARKDPRSNKQISITTVYHYIRNLKDFFKWLAYQPGYKSKICLTDVEFLKLDKQKSRIAMASKREHFPTFEQVKKVINTIKIDSELDLRDRALLSFTLLSGMRDSAIISLPIGCIDEERLIISQDPKMGVKTKFSKTIYSSLFRFDQNMLNYFLDWYNYLKKEKLFGNSDPIFPRNKVVNAEGTKSFVSNEVEPAFWQSVTSMREIFKARFKAADIEYFSPHTFRHLAVSLATKKCSNAEELKAISQNFGHEDVGTTFQTYGTLSNSRVSEVINNIDFSDSEDAKEKELFEKFKSLMKDSNKF